MDVIVDRSKYCFCNLKLAKYHCPACGISYCSLDCFKKHQNETLCTGIKEKVFNLKLSEMLILVDLKFLEDIKRQSDIRWRKLSKISSASINKKLHPKQKLLQKAAKTRNVKLSFQARGMQRSMNNSTMYIYNI